MKSKLYAFCSQFVTNPSRSMDTSCINRFNIKKTLCFFKMIHFFIFMDLRTKSDYFPIQHQKNGLYG